MDTVSILHGMRKYYEKKLDWYNVMFFVLFFILFIDINLIIFLRVVTLDSTAWIGIWLLIAGMSILIWQYNEAKKWIESIDGWYLEKTHELKGKV